MTILQLFDVMRHWVRGNWPFTITVYGLAIIVAFAYTMLRPREYVISMVILPIDATFSDPSALVSGSAFSFRSPIQLGQRPPVQLGAFLRILKSPELASVLAGEPKAVGLIRSQRTPGIVGRLSAALFSKRPLPPNRKTDTAVIYQWLQGHITAEQDVDVGTWGINIRYPTADGGVFLLNRIHADAENIIRKSEIDQLSTEWQYGTAELQSIADATERTTLYSILNSIQRSLLVLRSGTNVATITLSQPYAPPTATYPSRLLTLISALLPLLLLATGILLFLSYRSTKQRSGAGMVHAAVE